MYQKRSNLVHGRKFDEISLNALGEEAVQLAGTVVLALMKKDGNDTDTLASRFHMLSPG